jgi:hypothetical protein
MTTEALQTKPLGSDRKERFPRKVTEMTITVGRLLAFISVLAAMAIAAIILVSSLDHESGKAARGSSPVAPLLKKAQKVSTIDPIRSIQKEIAEDQFGSSSCSISKNGTGLSVDVLGAEAS